MNNCDTETGAITAQRVVKVTHNDPEGSLVRSLCLHGVLMSVVQYVCQHFHCSWVLALSHAKSNIMPEQRRRVLKCCSTQDEAALLAGGIALHVSYMELRVAYTNSDTARHHCISKTHMQVVTMNKTQRFRCCKQGASGTACCCFVVPAWQLRAVVTYNQRTCC